MRTWQCKPLHVLVVFAGLLAAPAVAQVQTYERGVRGVWITNVDSDVLKSRASIAEAMAYLASRNFNVVFPVVWNKGVTLYPSDLAEATYGIRQDAYFASRGRDPLQEIVEEARIHGLEVIPWFEFGFSSSYSAGGGPIISAKPHWAAIDNSGRLVVKNGFDWMNALHPEVQDFMIGLMVEVVQRYDVDGVQGDDRLPAMPSTGGYSEYTRALYASEHGGAAPPDNYADGAWVQWRADKLTAFLGRLHATIKAIDPNLTISMSPSIYGWSLQEYLQDWPEWLKQGFADIVHPQAYRYTIGDYSNILYSMAHPTLGYARDYLDRVYLGVLVKAGSRMASASLARSMINMNRQYGLNGEVFFFYDGLRSRNDNLADSLFTTHYSDTKVVMPFRRGIRRPTPYFIDESEASVSRTGTWRNLNSAEGFKDIAQYAEKGSGSSATYTFYAPYTGGFDIMVHTPPGLSDASTGAQLTIEAPDTTFTVQIDQQNHDYGRWTYAGTVSASIANRIKVRFDADGASDNGRTYLDVVALVLNRKLSPDVYVRAQIVDRESVPQPEQHEAELRAYPTPASDRVRLEWATPLTTDAHLAMYDTLGRVVYRTQVSHGAQQDEIDVSRLAPGLYLYQLTSQDRSMSTTVVIAR